MDAKLDNLTKLVTELTASVNGLKLDVKAIKDDIDNVRSNITDLNEKVDNIEDTIEETVDRKLETLNETWRGKMDTMVADAKSEIKECILGDVNDFVIKKLSEMGVPDMIRRQTEMENNLKNIQRLVDRPFDPERSIVVYSLADKEGETIDQTVSWLIKDVLGLTVTPKFYERTTSRGEKPGVLKIELHTTIDKVAILRAKKKCLDNDLTKKVRINSCDSHDARVAKLNARFLLNHLNVKDHIVSANGVIRQKLQDGEEGEIKEDEATPTPTEHVAAGTIINNDGDGEGRPPPNDSAKKPESISATPSASSGSAKKPENTADPKKPPKNQGGPGQSKPMTRHQRNQSQK